MQQVCGVSADDTAMRGQIKGALRGGRRGSLSRLLRVVSGGDGGGGGWE